MQAFFRKLLQHKKWLLLFVVLAIAVRAGILLDDDQQKPAIIHRILVVERGNIAAVVSATGTIVPVNSVNISSKLTGLIKEVKVSENDQVLAGQILVLIDDTKLIAQVAQTKAKLENAVVGFERAQQLNRIVTISSQQLDTARMELDVAKASYADSVSQLQDTIIRSPISGTVIGKPIPAGQTVSAGISTPMVLLTVADLSKMQIEAQIDESDIGKILVGQKANFTVDAYPDKVFTGIVASVSRKANIQQNVVYYPVIIDVDESGEILKPTMTVRVAVHVGESLNTLSVPLQAIKESRDQRYVQVLKNGQPQNVIVTTGLANDDRIEITRGLQEGDQIILPQSKAPRQQGTSNFIRNMLRR